MGKLRRTTEQFIKECTEIHNGKYSYEFTEYVGVTKKVKITCPIHGVFEQVADAHLVGKGCRKCAGSYNMTSEEFLEKARAKFGNSLDLSKTVYVNAKTKITAVCPIHGEFSKHPRYFLKSPLGCPKCGKDYVGLKNRKDTNSFVERSLKIHDGFYSYDKTEYVKNSQKVIITCPIHGDFLQTPQKHLDGNGCQACGLDKLRKAFSSNKEEFVARSMEVHNSKYTYENVDYINARTKVNITCPIHGSFWQDPWNHTQGCGCHSCKSSKGEIAIKKLLESKNIKFKREVNFAGNGHCRMRFDFFLPDYNTVIEYQGQQHYKPVSIFGGIDGFMKTKKRDVVKKHYCLNNDIYFIEIPYWEIDNVESILIRGLCLE